MDPFFTRPLVGSVPISSPFDSLLLIDLKIEYSPRGGDEESRDYDDGYGNNVVESNTHRSFLYELVRVSYSRPKFPAICVRFVTIADLRKKQSSERMMVGRGTKEVRF